METNTFRKHQQLDLVSKALEDTTSPSQIAKITKLPKKTVEEDIAILGEVLKTQYSDRYLEVVNKQALLLEEITDSLMPAVRRGEYKHADIAIKAITAYNILLGLNAPQKREVTEQKTSYTLKLTKKIEETE